MNKIKYILLLLMVCFITAWAQEVDYPDTPWNFLDNSTIGADTFIKRNPECDGRGVVLIICDSGVDMGIPGLLITSDGKQKVIDAQDFSGQGDIKLQKAEFDSTGRKKAIRSDNIRLYDYELLSYQPKDSVFWIGCLDEKNIFQNARARDINNNGRLDDRFGIVTFPVEVDGQEQWIYYIDQDGNNSLADEKGRFDYKYNFDSFTLLGRDEKNQKNLYTFAMNIKPDDKMASLHACDNSHGTHCAGIAAGYKIFGEPTQHGIAPGAQIISCKIGVGTLAGGATTTGSKKKAFEYGINYSKENDVPVVFTMSYGVGSEIEGRSDIEKLLNKLMEENDNIVIVTSNGNEGPGISSAGNPSCASRILGVGALLPFGSARDTYGFAIDKSRIFHFSSRGGECYKPDFLAPGAASSTVPYHANKENMWGTSMACPQAAGAAAILISACQAQNIPWNGTLIIRALKASATPLPEYTPLDQGRGVINIPKAFDILKVYAQRSEDKTILDYQVETECPQYMDEKGSNAYWRTGGYIPSPDEKQLFKVKALFPESKTADDRASFYRAFKIQCDQPWFKLDKSATYIRGENEAVFGGYYQKDQLQMPGLYVAKISAFPKSGPGKEISDFEILNCVIIPYEFNSTNNYQLEIKNKELKAGLYHRYFVLVPPGASHMTVTISPSNDKYCGIYGYVFDPNGIKIKTFPKIDPTKKQPVTLTVSQNDLVSGIWEIIPYAYFDVPQTSTYNLSINFSGLSLDWDGLDTLKYENGEHPSLTTNVMNYFTKFSGTASGSLPGYYKKTKLHMTDDQKKIKFKVTENIKKIEFQFSMSKETWNFFTDLAINISNLDGKYLVNEGLGNRKGHFTFNPPKAGEYYIEINAAFAEPDKKEKGWNFEMEQYFYTFENITIGVSKNDNEKFDIYPNMSTELYLEFSQAPRIIPEGFHYFSEIDFFDGLSHRPVILFFH